MRLTDLHVEPQPGSSLSTQELMTRLCFLLGDVTHGTDSTPMEDRREKKVGQHIDSAVPLAKWMIYETTLWLSLHQYFFLLLKLDGEDYKTFFVSSIC